MQIQHVASGLVATVLFIFAGCHSEKTPQAATPNLEGAQREAQREVAEARVEASKDIRSAAKVTGSSTLGVAEAKAEGAYDIAMAKADGQHKVATAKCLTLQMPMMRTCKDRADAGYESAKAAAKATRVARQ